MNILEISNLSVRFGDFYAVRNLTLHVKRGEILGLLGPNGSGKTTTIRAIFGMVPYEGKIRSYAASVGWMPQNSPLYLNLTVEENLRFFASLHGIRDERRVEEMLKLVQLEKYRRRLVKNLSGGMKQRAMLACSMLHDPELLILDEPTAGVDPPLRASFWEQFERLREEGKTILVTTHYMDEAERCERLVLIRNGEKIAEGKPEEIKRRAGADRVVLEVDNARRAAEILSDYRTSTNGRVVVEVDDAAAEVPRIIEMLSRAGVKVLRAEVRRCTLEEAFMRFMEG
ncbi:MAG: ABC transporter ATP-binding protein [Archaeoglobaceae archaeon]